MILGNIMQQLEEMKYGPTWVALQDLLLSENLVTKCYSLW